MFCSFQEKDNIDYLAHYFLYAISSRESIVQKNISLQDFKEPFLIEINPATGHVFLTKGEEFLPLFQQLSIQYCPCKIKTTEHQKGFFTPVKDKKIPLQQFVRANDIFLFSFDK
jgi:hypothetical protein